jgi:hypothetical protein
MQLVANGEVIEQGLGKFFTSPHHRMRWENRRPTAGMGCS